MSNYSETKFIKEILSVIPTLLALCIVQCKCNDQCWHLAQIKSPQCKESVFVGASTMLSSAEFICLRVVIARSSGRNCALAAPVGSRNQYEFICQGRDRLMQFRIARLIHFAVVSCVHCTSFAFLFLVDIVGISKVSFAL